MPKFLVLLLKISITAVLVWLVLQQVDVTRAGAFLSSKAALLPVGICVALFIIQAGLAAVRMRLIMRLLGEDFSVDFGFSTWMIGLLFGQVLITFIAGDAARIWLMVRGGYRRRTAASAVFLERALGFAVLMIMVVPSAIYLLGHATSGPIRTGLLIVLLTSIVGVLCFIGSGFIQRVVVTLLPKLHAQRFMPAIIDVTSTARHLSRIWPITLWLTALSALMHMCNVVAFYALLKALDVDIGIAADTAISLTVMLLSLLPIALAGWGVREGVAVIGYGLFGVSSEVALTASIGFGLSLLLTCLIAVPYLVSARRQIAQEQGA